MKYKTIACIALALLTLTGCGSLPQKGRISIARREYEAKKFAACLSSASIAEAKGSFSAELDAQIMYYKAMCLEGMGEEAASVGVFETLVDRYPETLWAKNAARMLEHWTCTSKVAK